MNIADIYAIGCLLVWGVSLGIVVAMLCMGRNKNAEKSGVSFNLNSFQHKAYLKNECEAQGYDLTAIGDTSSAPLTLYSKKVDSLKALKELAGKKED